MQVSPRHGVAQGRAGCFAEDHASSGGGVVGGLGVAEEEGLFERPTLTLTEVDPKAFQLVHARVQLEDRAGALGQMAAPFQEVGQGPEQRFSHRDEDVGET